MNFASALFSRYNIFVAKKGEYPPAGCPSTAHTRPLLEKERESCVDVSA